MGGKITVHCSIAVMPHKLPEILSPDGKLFSTKISEVVIVANLTNELSMKSSPQLYAGLTSSKRK